MNAVLGRFYKFAAVAVLLAGAWNGRSETETVDGRMWTYAISSGGATVTGVSPATGGVTIPSSLGGYPVTNIGSSAFYGCSELTSVAIPSSVTSIGASAFYGCSGLTSVTIPSSVTNIGFYAFCRCSGLTSVTIPTSVTSIASEAFRDCSGLTSVTIPEGVASIGSYAFYGCSGLTSVTIPSSVTSIWGHAFCRCSGLTSVTIPEGVTSIGNSAFSGCSGLTSVTIPEGVTSIGDFAFYDCSGLTLVTIPSGVASIGESAFDSCRGLTSVTIPEGVTSIGSSAFNGCSGLTSVTIPSSVTSIGRSAFSNTKLLNDHSDGFVIIDNCLIEYKGTCPGEIVVPDGVRIVADDAFAGRSMLTWVTIPSGVTNIGGYAFHGCSRLTSVTIPEGVTSIENGTFYGCSGLTSVTIPSSVTSIGGNAFHDCSGMTSVTIPEGVTSIGSCAFYGCSGMTSVTIPSSVTSIGSCAFVNCNGVKAVKISDLSAWCRIAFEDVYANPLRGCALYLNDEEVISMTLPVGVTAIGDYAFYDCSGLTSVTIPSSVTNIGDWAFSFCSGLTSVTIPEGVTSIGESVFHSCRGLTSVTIPSSVTSIASEAFRDCSGLTSVTISEGVRSIAQRAFFDCSRLTSVTIPSSVTSIGESVFSNTKLLNDHSDGLVIIDNCLIKYKGTCPGEIEVPDGVRIIAPYAFYSCRGLTSVTIPSSVTSIGDNAFYGRSGLTRVDISNLASWCEIGFHGDCSNPLFYAKHLYLNGEEVKDLVIPEVVTSIGSSAFSGCSGLASVTIPSSVTSIGESAFHDCSGLTSVTIPSSVTSIGDRAFSGCSGLTSVTIPSSVTSIGKSAFSGCSGLTLVTIPSGVTSIGEYAFNGCSGITSVTIPSSVTSIGSSAFGMCDKLKVVYVGRGDVQRVRGLYAWPNDVTFIDPFAKSFTISYENLHEATHTNPETYQAGVAINFTPPSGRTGYAFTGWTPAEITADMAGAQTVTAGWRANVYQILYDANGGAGTMSVTECEYDKECEVAANGFVRSGYVFKGWATEGNGKVVYEPGAKVMNLTAIAGGTIKFYAVWAWAATTARQRYPWNGLVDIAVTIQGAAEDVAEYECVFAATNSATKAAIPIEHVTRNGDDEGSDGIWTRKFIWDAKTDLGEVRIDDVVLTVDVKPLGGVQLWEGGPYWAECNVGASRPEEYGYYFWWGDTVGYKRNANDNGWISVKDGSGFSFGSDNCPTYDMDKSQLESAGYIDLTGNLVSAHDAATVHLGVPWRMPTDAEFSALNSNCTTIWTTRNGVYGRLVTGKETYSSKSIFLPAAGYGDTSYLCRAGAHGYCWSSTPLHKSNYAWHLHFYSSLLYSDIDYRNNGRSVRPVRGFANASGGRVVLPDDAVTTHLSLDTRVGSRALPAEGANIRYDASWCGSGVLAMIEDNGTVVASGACGDFLWLPTDGGAHTLKLSVFDGASSLVGLETAEFVVVGRQSITYTNLHGATHSNPASYQEGTDVNFTPPNGRTGYTFTGWTPAAITAGMTGAQTVTAGWRANAYQITYYANGGSGTMTATDCEYDKEGEIAANDFTRSGYVFKGWATEENDEVVYRPGDKVTNLTSNDKGVVKLYAVWEIEPEPLTLASALGEPKLYCVGTGGDVEWVPVVDETAEVGTSSAVSGALDEDDEGTKQVSWLEAKVYGRGTLAFWWRVNCDPDPRKKFTYDYAAFETDDDVVARRDGVTEEWEQVVKTFDTDGEHVIRWRYNADGYLPIVGEYEGCVWVNGVTWSGAEPPASVVPSLADDPGATMTGDAEAGFVVRPSEGNTTVEVTIPQGVDAAKVTVEVSTKVASVKPNGAKVKIVSGGADITEFLNMPAADGNGVVDLTKATVKEEIVKEAMDIEKGAKIELDAANPSLTTPNTRKGLFYQLREGVTLDGMKDGDSTVGDGQPWSPEITVKGGNSAFYSIGVGKGE